MRTSSRDGKMFRSKFYVLVSYLLTFKGRAIVKLPPKPSQSCKNAINAKKMFILCINLRTLPFFKLN